MKKARTVKIGKYTLGHGKPVRVQSMTNTDTKDIKSTIKQIRSLLASGCEIIRLSVPDMDSAKNIKMLKKEFPDIPLVADIHYDHILALESIKNGIDKVRLNPGNIGNRRKIKEIVNAAKDKGIPIRIGINSGSIPDDLLKKYGRKPDAKCCLSAAEREVGYLEELDLRDIVVSIKSTDIQTTVDANRMFRNKYDHPLHLGITESGTLFSGTIRSAVGIGILLNEKIGETIRVSLSADPIEEVRAGWEILKCLGIRKRGVTVHSCPTCARTCIDVIGIANEIEKICADREEELSIAVMGCVVNGPKESENSDIGIVGTTSYFVIYKKGELIKKFPLNTGLKQILEFLLK